MMRKNFMHRRLHIFVVQHLYMKFFAVFPVFPLTFRKKSCKLIVVVKRDNFTFTSGKGELR